MTVSISVVLSDCDLKYPKDFRINGVSLFLKMTEDRNRYIHLVSNNDSIDKIINTSVGNDLLLIGHSQDFDGRVLLYVCADCKDIACGSYTVDIKSLNGYFIWSGFRYENGHSEPILLNELGPFKFRTKEYREAIRNLA